MAAEALTPDQVREHFSSAARHGGNASEIYAAFDRGKMAPSGLPAFDVRYEQDMTEEQKLVILRKYNEEIDAAIADLEAAKADLRARPEYPVISVPKEEVPVDPIVEVRR